MFSKDINGDIDQKWIHDRNIQADLQTFCSALVRFFDCMLYQ